MQYSQMIEGLQIFAKYDPDGLNGMLTGADHDVVWGAPAVFEEDDSIEQHLVDHGEYPNIPDIRMSPEDNARLYELGWFIDPDVDGWSHFC